jgi:hypothetical protein
MLTVLDTGTVVGGSISSIPHPGAAQGLTGLANPSPEEYAVIRRIRSGAEAVNSYALTIQTVTSDDPDYNRLVTMAGNRGYIPVRTRVRPVPEKITPPGSVIWDRAHASTEAAWQSLRKFGPLHDFIRARDMPAHEDGTLYTTRSISAAGDESWECLGSTSNSCC